jgi:hypothetical protein
VEEGAEEEDDDDDEEEEDEEEVQRGLKTFEGAAQWLVPLRG